MHHALYPSLRGRAVVISGGASGIGEALVRRFAEQGARVGFLDIAKDQGKALETELIGLGQTAHFIACDVTDIASYQSAIASLASRHGDARVLINNAGHDQRHRWDEVTPEDWDAKMAVNLKHFFFAIQAVAPGMKAAGGGSIINFGSISWMILTPRIPIYETAKAAVHGMTRAMARELGRDAIRVNSLVPGAVVTPRQLALWVTPEDLKIIEQQQALSGSVMPDDCARMALFLAADDSAMISGQQFLVDGGWAHT